MYMYKGFLIYIYLLFAVYGHSSEVIMPYDAKNIYVWGSCIVWHNKTSEITETKVERC